MTQTARTVLLFLLTPVIFSCSSNGASWTPYLFNGSGFYHSMDAPSKALWIRPGYFPYSGQDSPQTSANIKLPKGTGAVAGICYLQTSGGKIANQNMITPLPDEQITMKLSGEGVFVTRTDEQGYFTDALYPGDYEFYCRGVKVSGRIRPGETTLIPLRGGKRMAD